MGWVDVDGVHPELALEVTLLAEVRELLGDLDGPAVPHAPGSVLDLEDGLDGDQGALVDGLRGRHLEALLPVDLGELGLQGPDLLLPEPFIKGPGGVPGAEGGRVVGAGPLGRSGHQLVAVVDDLVHVLGLEAVG